MLDDDDGMEYMRWMRIFPSNIYFWRLFFNAFTVFAFVMSYGKLILFERRIQ